MKAAVLHAFGGPENFRWQEVPDPQVGPGEVLVRVRACGVCGHDLINRAGYFPRTKLPAILGHEVAGEVVAVGPDVTGLKPGDRVGSSIVSACGHCKFCLTGRENLCRNGQMPGEEVPGGYAEYMKAPASYFLPIPPDMPFPQAAIIACTLGTAYHAIVKRGRLQMGESILITGASGGVGIHAIQIAKLLGARVIAVTTTEAKVPKLKEAGADEVIVSPQMDFGPRAKELTGGEGVEMALEIVGSATYPASLRSLAFGGRLVFVGNLLAEPVQVRPAEMNLKELELYGTKAISRGELMTVMSLVQEGRLRPVIDRTLPLSEVAEAHRLMAEKQTIGRVVLTG